MRILTLILLTLLVSNCSSTKLSTNNTPLKINFKQLIAESQGGFSSAKFLIIKEKQTTQDVYNQINNIRNPGFEVPTIDYNKQMLFALFMGEKSSGGYTISVDHIIESSNRLTVFINETSPKGMTTMAITSPFCFVLLEKSDKEIIFKKMK
ncbi:MAG: hypothetical protein COB98_01365 [Flavobacteriaceae bacterium]|nr:MAG: hypothetical protein COB98_01365 [Flavobacteriaceae bacterium]